MPANINSTPQDSLPVLLKKDDQAEQANIGICHELAPCWSRILLKMGISMVTAAAVVIAFLYYGNQITFFGTAKPLLLAKSAVETDQDQSTPPIHIAGTQSQPLTPTNAPGVNPGQALVLEEPALNEKTAADDKSTLVPPASLSATDANAEPVRATNNASLPNERNALDDKRALAPPASYSATDVSAHKEAARAPASNDTAASRPADQNVIQAAQPSDEALFKEYQAWRAALRERTQPAQAAPARTPQLARPQGQQNARLNQDASAQIRPLKNSQKHVRRVQTTQQNASAKGAPAPAPSVRLVNDSTSPNAPAPDDPSTQNAQTRSLFQIFGKPN
jgi:hypothetical protein